MAAGDQVPPPEQLQFRRAQRLDEPATRVCIVCKEIIPGDYYEANGNILCPQCAERVRSQQVLPSTSLAQAALYGTGAALAGSLIYAAVAIFLHLEIGIIAILIGYMVGKSIHYAAGGGRPQQILAVTLTYFAITSSFIEMFLYQASQSGTSINWGGAIVPLAELAVAAPFLALLQKSNAISALISLFIIFIGLRQAWGLTAGSKLVINGPFPGTL